MPERARSQHYTEAKPKIHTWVNSGSLSLNANSTNNEIIISTMRPKEIQATKVSKDL